MINKTISDIIVSIIFKKGDKMEKRGILLSCMVASLVMSSGYANASNYVVDDLNTTGVILQNSDNFAITSAGNIEISSNANETAGVNSNSTGEINNSGHISIVSSSKDAFGYGSGVMQTANANSITNSGSIEVDSTSGAWAIGIAQMFGNKLSINDAESTVDSAKTAKGNITNSGLIDIKAEAQAVGILEVYGDVVNSGTINIVVTDDLNTSDDYATGIWQLDGSNVTNSGDITVTSYGDGYSMGIEADNNASINNSGTVLVQSNDSSALGIYGEGDGGQTVVNSGNVTTISYSNRYSIGLFVVGEDANNTGTITAISHNDSSSEGIYGEETNIVNLGTIKSEAEDGYANGIHSSGEDGQMVVNSGTIEATTSGSGSAVGIRTSHQDVSNLGTITATSYGDAQSTGIYGFAGDISNSGTIDVKSANAAAVGILSQGSGDEIITNSGTIIAQASAEDHNSVGILIPENLFNGTISNAGTIKADTAIYIEVHDQNQSFISNSGLMETNSILAPFSTFTNSGTLHLNYAEGATVSVDTFRQTASGVFNVDAEIKDEDNVYAVHSAIVATTAVDIEDGSTIDVNLISQSNTLTKAFLDDNGTIDSLIVSDDINTNVDKLNITDNSPIIDFEAYLSDDDKALSLRAVKATTISLQDSPLSTLSASTAITAMQNTANGIIQTRQNSTRGLNSGDIAFKDRHIWFKPFGIYTKQDNKDGINGFDANTYGFGIGVDGEYKEGRRAGLTFFYSNTSLDVNDITQSDDIDMFNFMAYGSNPMIDDKTMLFYQVGFGIQRNSSKRYISSIAQSAKADYTSKSFYIQAKATRDYSINDKLTIIPAIKGVLTYLYTPSYSESGAGIYNQNVQSNSDTQVILRVSTNLNYKINDTTKLVSNVALDYNFNNDAQSVDFYFQGAPDVVFNTKGIENSALGYGLGLGISKELKKNLVLDLKYNLNGRGSDYINHSLMAKFEWKF